MRARNATGLHICQISTTGTDQRGEWVSVVNDGPTGCRLTGLELTDYTRTQQHVHIYRFPGNATRALVLGPGETAFVFTAPGRDEWVSTSSRRRQLLLFAGRRAPIWNNTGDVAYLRDARGEFVDSMTVGDPPRHPFGHQGR